MKWKLKHFHLLLLDETVYFKAIFCCTWRVMVYIQVRAQHSVTCIAWSVELALILIWMNFITVEGVQIDSPADQSSQHDCFGEKCKICARKLFQQKSCVLKTSTGRCAVITLSVQSLANSGSVYEMAVSLHSSAYIKSSRRLHHLYSGLGAMQHHQTLLSPFARQMHWKNEAGLQKSVQLSLPSSNGF